MSVNLVIETVKFIQSDLSCLYYLSSAISYLDMILSFVGYILSTSTTCIYYQKLIGKPKFMNTPAKNIISLNSSQHPILERITPSFIPVFYF